MTEEGVSLTKNELWLLHTLAADSNSSPSGAGFNLQPSTLPAGSPPWAEVRVAVDGLVALRFITAKAQHVLGRKGVPTCFFPTHLTDKAVLLLRGLQK